MICPLNSIIEDQSEALLVRRISSTVMNFRSALSQPITAKPDLFGDHIDESPNSKTSSKSKNNFENSEYFVKTLKEEKCKIVFTHPESLLSSSGRLVMKNSYVKRILFHVL